MPIQALKHLPEKDKREKKTSTRFVKFKTKLCIKYREYVYMFYFGNQVKSSQARETK